MVDAFGGGGSDADVYIVMDPGIRRHSEVLKVPWTINNRLSGT